MTRIGRNLAYAALLILSLASLAGCGGPRDTWKVKAGDSLPSFTLKATDGTSHSLADKKGNVVLVAVFATWCGPCMQELPELESELYKPLKDKGLTVLAINAGEEAGEVQKFAKSSGLTFPILLDESAAFSDAVGGSFLPRSILIDKNGKVRSLHIGYDPQELRNGIRQEIEALLKET